MLLQADEEEEELIDVATTKGYEQIVAVWEARDDVDAVLGRRAWKTFFLAMSEGRLRPTPWLNKVLYSCFDLNSALLHKGVLHGLMLIASAASSQNQNCYSYP